MVYQIWVVTDKELKISCFIKQYENFENKTLKIEGGEFKFPKQRYYDEREWRYVPNVYPNSETILLLNEYGTKGTLANEKIRKKHTLSFSFEDIKHITFETENNKQEIVKTLKKRYGKSILMNDIGLTQI